jgi:hypothetical protein
MFESLTISILWAMATWIIANIILGVMDVFREVDTELTDKIRQRLDEIVHRVEVEQQGDVYYWYDQDNRKFLAQGRTTEELVAVIKNRFPQHIFYFEQSNHLICAKHNWEPQPARLSDKS